MPANIRTPEPYDYSDDLTAGRADVQVDAHRFFDTLFEGRSVLDVGAGLGKSKERITRNRVTTWDIDARLVDYVDIAGGPMPGLRGGFGAPVFDVVTAFDVLEHVEDDRKFFADLLLRAKEAVFITTPNWEHTRCNEAKGGSTHHWREYTAGELTEFIMLAFACSGFRFRAGHVLSYYKDAVGGWWEPYDPAKHARKFGLLVCTEGEQIDTIMAQIHAAAPKGRVPG